MSPNRNPFLLEKAAKKQFFPNIHQNSEDFKDLGTFHLERRNIDYYPQEDYSQQRKIRAVDISTP